jgi:hypothetical protein
MRMLPILPIKEPEEAASLSSAPPSLAARGGAFARCGGWYCWEATPSWEDGGGRGTTFSLVVVVVVVIIRRGVAIAVVVAAGWTKLEARGGRPIVKHRNANHETIRVDRMNFLMVVVDFAMRVRNEIWAKSGCEDGRSPRRARWRWRLKRTNFSNVGINIH